MADLIDLIENGVMKYDGYEGTVIGNLTVVGWNGKRGNYKKYIVTCSICSLDTELHGDGFFAMAKGHLVRGCIPCGCTDKASWTEEQYKTRLERAGTIKGFKFLGWNNNFTTANATICLVQCTSDGHGTGKGPISFMLVPDNMNFGCPQCKTISVQKAKRKDDAELIKTFMSTGAYHPDTVFTRSDRKDSSGWLKYWYMDCPDCGTIGEGHIVGIYEGARSCECSNNRQTQGYINLIKDNQQIIAIKYGIAVVSHHRIKRQQTNCIYDIENYGVWEFPNVKDCKAAERTCSTTLPRNYLSKQELKDGYTETLNPLYIEDVIKIYTDYGGVRIN